MELNIDALGAAYVAFLVTGFALTMAHTFYRLWRGEWD